MKIGILGGSFDPPHLGHLLIAQQIKQHLNLDKIWLMPVFKHPFNKSIADAKHRLKMTQLLDNESLQASDIEIQRKETSYTIDTLEELAQKFPSDTFYWIIGSDQIAEFPKWKRYKDIIQNFHLIIYSRDNVQEHLEKTIKYIFGVETIPGNIFILNTQDMITTTISSSDIRDRIKKGIPVRSLVPKKIEEYIKEQKLYIEYEN